MESESDDDTVKRQRKEEEKFFKIDVRSYNISSTSNRSSLNSSIIHSNSILNQQ